MNAITQNVYTHQWQMIGNRITRPKSILAISAHWYVPGTYVTSSAKPPTIHDFGGFPARLNQFTYPAPGDPQLAQRVGELAGSVSISLSEDWGLDHGTWSVLCHLFPNADIPVVQISIDETKPADFHYALGQQLEPLRDEGVLIIGSGNLVHNLHAYAWGSHAMEPYDWASRFEHQIRQHLQSDDPHPVIAYETLGSDALLSVPTPEHYLPLLYVLGTRRAGEQISFPVEGVDGGSISMLAVEVG